MHGFLHRPRPRARRDARRHQAGVQAARAPVSPGHQSGRSDGGGAVPADRGGVRDAERSGSPAPLRHGRRPRPTPARAARSASRGSISRSASAARRRRPSAICSPTCFSSASARRRTARRARRRSASDDHAHVRGGDARRPARASPSRGRSTAARCRGAGGCTSPRRRCLPCHGTGVVKSARGHMVFSKPCAHCGGTGRQRRRRAARRAAASRSRCGPSR